ncbi:MAG: DUF2490 domain-containing protein [Candidatus Sericytochromatia bacterium]|nr:DUF2490 domain-containing protein [Candidatus Sericytochromatia bacterium]
MGTKSRAGLALGLALAGLGAWPSPVLADSEFWNVLEVRVPLERPVPWSPRALRAVSSSRFGFRYGGLGVSSLRVGPLWQPAPWLMLGLHASAYAEQAGNGAFNQMLRLECEPNLQGAIGDLQINDRNRLEWRHTPGDVWWRYRNQLRVSYQPAAWNWWPTLSQELAWDLRPALPYTLVQSRFTVGAARVINRATRLTTEYMWRQRPDPLLGWAHDHILMVTLLFAPDLTSEAGRGHAGGD